MKKGILAKHGFTLHREYLSLGLSLANMVSLLALLTTRETQLISMKSPFHYSATSPAKHHAKHDQKYSAKIYAANTTKTASEKEDAQPRVSNRFQQRAQGQAHIVIDKERWWEDMGENANETVGVTLSVVGAGAVIFSNTVYNMPAIILADYLRQSTFIPDGRNARLRMLK
jgi:hypothetical protein